jgi:hypothetical protein
MVFNDRQTSDVITMARMMVQASTMAVHLIGISYVVRA